MIFFYILSLSNSIKLSLSLSSSLQRGDVAHHFPMLGGELEGGQAGDTFRVARRRYHQHGWHRSLRSRSGHLHRANERHQSGRGTNHHRQVRKG